MSSSSYQEGVDQLTDVLAVILNPIQDQMIADAENVVGFSGAASALRWAIYSLCGRMLNRQAREEKLEDISPTTQYDEATIERMGKIVISELDTIDRNNSGRASATSYSEPDITNGIC